MGQMKEEGATEGKWKERPKDSGRSDQGHPVHVDQSTDSTTEGSK